MKVKNRTLKKAIRLLRKGMLTKCTQLLEPKISLFIDNADYFYLLGRSYFTAGDLESAELYLKRGLDSNPNHPEIQLLLACYAIKQRDTYKAIATWLNLENQGCTQKCIRYGLAQMRHINDNEELYNFARSTKYRKIYPPLPGQKLYYFVRLLKHTTFSTLIVASIWLCYIHGVPKLQSWYKNWSTLRVNAVDINLKQFEKRDYFVRDEKEYLFQFDTTTLTKIIDNIRTHYNQYYDNLVQKDINRILLSNASKEIKGKFHTLENHLNKTEIYNLKHNFPFSEVKQNPVLYHNCLVKWEGKAVNIQIDSKNQMQFILLVGYTDGSILQGSLPVILDTLVHIPSADAILVFGQIKLIDPYKVDKNSSNFNYKKYFNYKKDPNKGFKTENFDFYIKAKTISLL